LSGAPFLTLGGLPPGFDAWGGVGIGIAFGWCLERGGLGNARKLAGQFYLTDLTVFKVLFSAVVTAMLGVFWLSRIGVLEARLLDTPPTYLVPVVLGGLVFGIGFALCGLCPGTSCVSAATGRVDGLLVMAGMFLGVLGFMELHPLLEGFHNSTPRGTVTLPALLALSPGVVVMLVTVAGLAAFLAGERIAPHHPARPRLRRGLAALALVLGVGSAAASSGAAVPWPGSSDGTPTVSPLDLARAIRDGERDIRVLDVRSGAEYEAFHLPLAESAPVGELAQMDLDPEDRVVVYGFGTEDGLRGAWILGRKGLGDVRALEGGAVSWMLDIMMPSVPPSPGPDERAHVDEVAEISRYFGGTPSFAPRPVGAPSLTELLGRARRASCGW